MKTVDSDSESESELETNYEQETNVPEINMINDSATHIVIADENEVQDQVDLLPTPSVSNTFVPVVAKQNKRNSRKRTLPLCESQAKTPKLLQAATSEASETRSKKAKMTVNSKKNVSVKPNKKKKQSLKPQQKNTKPKKKTKAKPKPNHENTKWVHTNHFVNTNADIPFEEIYGPSRRAATAQDPLEVFRLFFDDDLLDIVVTETNRFAKDKPDVSWVDVRKEEIMAFLG